MTLELQRWKHKFEIKPGVWVFAPSPEAVKNGSKILNAVRKHWNPPLYFFHLRTGGHLKAARLHLKNTYFAVVDIKQFFLSTSRRRVTRCLNEYFSYEKAREISRYSTVKNPSSGLHKYVLPFGFVQSPILATLCLDKSYLGSLLRKLSRKGTMKLSIYMDDVFISSNDFQTLQTTYQEILQAMEKSGYKLNLKKSQPPSNKIVVFNISLRHGNMSVTAERLSEFLIDFYASNDEQHKLGIANYVRSVNLEQAKLFR